MIAHLTGEVMERATQCIVVDVAGVGYSVAVVDERAYSLRERVSLHIYVHWNQEQGPLLYGFADAFSKTVFAAIVSCSGYGPKIGLAILAHLSPQAFLQAIMVANSAALSAIQGIGSKKAELLITHLKDKIPKLAISEPEAAGSTEHANNAQTNLIKVKTVHEALAGLIYKPQEITLALEYLHNNDCIETNSVDELLHKGLSFLAKRV